MGKYYASGKYCDAFVDIPFEYNCKRKMEATISFDTAK